MKPIILAILFLLSSGVARAEMWKCVDQDGNTRYTNEKKEAEALINCRALSLDPKGGRPIVNSRRELGAASTDALIVLTTVGYLAGAADGCKVAPKESNALSSGIALAINRGNYGDPAQHVLLNNARQKGVAEAAAREVDCTKIGDSVREYVHSMRSK